MRQLRRNQWLQLRQTEKLRCLALAASLFCYASLAKEASPTVQTEIDRQVNALSNHSPARVEVACRSLNSKKFILVASNFMIDGSPVPTPDLGELNKPGRHPLYIATVSPGKHTLVSRLIYTRTAASMFDPMAFARWKLTSEMEFGAYHGLLITVDAVPDVLDDPRAPKFNLTHEVHAQLAN